MILRLNHRRFVQAERGQGLLDPLGWVWDFGLSDMLKHRSRTECRDNCPAHVDPSGETTLRKGPESYIDARGAAEIDLEPLPESASDSSGRTLVESYVKVIVGVNVNLYKVGDREGLDGGLKEDVHRTLMVS